MFLGNEDVIDILYSAEEKALSLGASYAEARFHLLERQGVIARNDAIIGTTLASSRGIAIRVVFKGALGFSSTYSLSKEDVLKAAERAVSQAKEASVHMKSQIIFSNEKLGRAKVSVIEKKKIDDLSTEEMINLLMDSWDKVKSADIHSKIPVYMQNLSWSKEYKVIVNSDGGFVESYVPRVFYFFNLVEYNDGNSINKWYEYAASGGSELAEEFVAKGRQYEDVYVLDKILRKAKPSPKGRMDVVLGDEIVGLLAHESSGHPSEADRILGREAAQAGKSFIKPTSLGTRIGSEIVSVVDDPTIPGSNGFFLYDDEAVPARKKYLYKNGVINEYLHNRYTGYLFGKGSNGSARAMDAFSEPIIRMSNTYIEPRDHSLDELIEDIDYGIYMKSYMEWNIDDERWGNRYVGLEAYLIENGEIKDLVKNPVLEATTGEIYSSIDAVGKDLVFHAGTCGKGEPSQGVPVWFGGPPIRIRKVRIL
jgi:TldD protein